jgi:hypothetical protein
LFIKHVVEGGDLSVFVGNLHITLIKYQSRDNCTCDRELHVGWSKSSAELVDVFNPPAMVLQAVGRDSDKFDIAFSKFVSTASDLAELCGANGGKISWMREENRLYNELVNLLKVHRQ